MSLRDRMLRWFFLESTGGLWLALTYDVVPSNATGGMLGEPIAEEYQRTALPRGRDHWQASGFGEVQNTQAALWPKAAFDWGLFHGWALVDSESGSGQVLASGSLLTPIYVVQTMQPAMAARGLVIALED